MSRKAQPISVVIMGRRYFDGCNTYCTASIFLGFRDAKSTPSAYGWKRSPVILYSEYQTGGGDYYAQAAAEVIDAAGYMPGREKHPHGGSEAAWRYFRQDRGIAYHAEVVDVKRKKDLHS